MSWIYQEVIEIMRARNRTHEDMILIMSGRRPVPRVPVNRRWWPIWNSRSREGAIVRQDRLVQLLRLRLDRFLKDTMNAAHEHHRIRWKILRPDGRTQKTDPRPDSLHPSIPRTSHMKTNSKISQLRDDLVDLFHKLERKEISPAVATEMNNSAGKAINSAKVELEYRTAQLRNKELVIDFLESGK